MHPEGSQPSAEFVNPDQIRRQLAEKTAERRYSHSQDDLEVLSREEIRRMLYELRVHQIELEMQNEELRRAQEELDVSRDRYFDLYDLAPVGYLTMGEDGSIVEANLTAADLLGVARSTLVKQPLSRFILKDDQDIYYRHRRQLLETRLPQLCELRLVRADGTPLWTRLETNAAETGISGSSTCRVAMSDISESKRAALERQELQAQLAQAQKMEAVGRLAGGIAHDFNNILTAIILQLQVIRLQQNDPAGAPIESVDELLEAADRASSLVGKLLLFSRGQAIKTSRHEANAIVLGVTRLLERLLGENLVLTHELSAEPLWVEGDAGMIEQVVMNLCVNARDAMPEGGRLTVATHPVVLDEGAIRHHSGVRPGEFVCLQVSDTGSGIGSAIRGQIFDPFFTTKPPGGGTGLGLATVHGIVAKHGGFVDVQTQVAEGSTFRVYLPRAAIPGTPPRRDASVEIGGGLERILLVEDELLVRRLAARSLRRLGYRVTEAANGPEAMSIWRQQQGEFDLLFTDMVMPGGISGLALCSQLRKLKPGLKTVLTSGHSDEIASGEHYLAPDIRLLPKPYDIAALTITIRECLGPRPE